jgi:hypothetical protein
MGHNIIQTIYQKTLMNTMGGGNSIDDLDLVEGQTYRGNCPKCGGRNTFTASRKLGKIVWNCYKASCGFSGAQQKMRSISAIKEALKKTIYKPQLEEFVLPDTFIDSLLMEHTDYLCSVNATQAEVKLDVRENRVVFIIRDPDTGKIVGAVGRAMQKQMLPKWRRYDRQSDLLYFSGTGSVGVLVEDCPSACAVANAGYTGIALLGTSLHDGHIPKLLHFDRLIVALDKDASRKAITLKKRLDDYIPTTVSFLQDDLKRFLPQDIQVILG